MPGPLIINDIVQWLADRPGVEYHYTAIATDLGLDGTNVSNALNNEAGKITSRVVRVRKGVWMAKITAPKITVPTGGSAPNGLPSLLEFMGTNRDGTVLYRDPDTMELWKAERN